jgi:cell volume regulation protein A
VSGVDGLADGVPILVAGVLLCVAIAASMTANRLRLPALVLFLGLGMAVGSDGAGWIVFDDYALARDFGTIALCLILFDGGLGTGFAELRTVLGPALRLAVLATIGTALMTGLAASLLLGMPLLRGLLLGSIVASTDSAAIFALLRGSSLRRRLARTLEGESGFNDPIAVLLVLGFMAWMRLPGWGIWNMAALFGQQLVAGAISGLVVGWLAVSAFRHLSLPAPGLFPVASIAAAALAYGGATTLHGSGFLAVYLAGLMLADAPIPARGTIGIFHEGGAWIAQISLFLILGLLVSPARLSDGAAEGVVLSVVVLVARVLAAAVATLPDRFSVPERLVLGWAGLRGAVPVVLATLPVTAGLAHGGTLFNVVFIVVVLSALVQGATVESLARILRVTSPAPVMPRPLSDWGTIRRLGAEIVEYPVSPVDGVVGRHVADLGLPDEATVNVIVRGDEAIPPTGSVRVKAGDRLHLLVRREVAGEVAALVTRWENGDAG